MGYFNHSSAKSIPSDVSNLSNLTYFVNWDLLSFINTKDVTNDLCIFQKVHFQSIIDKLFSLLRSKYLVSLSGYEPLLYPHLSDLISYLFSTDKIVNIILQIYDLIDLDLFRDIVKLCPSQSLQLPIKNLIFFIFLILQRIIVNFCI